MPVEVEYESGCHVALSAAERCTLARIIEGDGPKQIALSRGVSLRTIRNQIYSLHVKLNLSRTHPDVVNWGIAHLQCCVRPWEHPNLTTISRGTDDETCQEQHYSCGVSKSTHVA